MFEKLKNIKKENLYLVLALTFGLAMAVFNPPFAGVPDEGSHYLRVLAISEGNISCASDGKMNVAAFGLAEELKPYKVGGTGDEKISMGKIRTALFEKDSTETIKHPGSVCGSNPLGYAPQVIGVTMAKIFNIPVLWGFYFGRIFNLLAAVFITYAAIKILPFGKNIFLVMALLPMTIQQYASVSYDPLHISTILLFAAYTIKLATKDGGLTRKEIIQLGLLATIAANIKWGFMPIILFLFLVPINKFKNKKIYTFFILGLFSLNALLLFVTQGNSATSEGVRQGIYPAEQIAGVLKNPLGFVYIVFNTIYDDFNFFFETFLYKPGWLRISLSPLLYIFILFGSIVLIRSEQEKVSLSKMQRLIMGGASLVCILFVFFSMYVLWSKVGGQKIQGVQGRYFLAFVPLLVMAFYKSGFNLRFEWVRKNYEKAIAIFLMLVFFFTFLTLWNIYYDKTESTEKYSYEKWITKSQTDVAEKVLIKNEMQQTFLATKDNLTGIKFYFQKGTFAGKGTFYLKDGDCNEVLRKKESSWNGDEFGSVEAKFGVVANSSGKRYCFTGELEAEPQMQVKIAKDMYPEGGATFDQQENAGDLIFDIIYNN